jgi:predicted phage terminase large subunit-like protein
VGGGITGKGAHVLIIDDPIKNIEEADSVLVRNALWEWYLSTAYTRLAPGGGVLVIETWWNDDDLAGRLQSIMANDPEADQFEIVKYPAEAERFEYRRPDTLEILRFEDPSEAQAYEAAAGISIEPIRAKGDPLHADRYPQEALKRIKANQTPRIWSALYQQNPVPDEGMYFKKEWFRMVPVLPDPYGMNIFTAWDFAIGERTHNDWTVGVTLLQDSNDCLYVLDLIRFKGDSLQIVDSIVNMSSKWCKIPGVNYKVGFEDGQIWKSIEPLVKKRMQERLIFPSYEILKPLTDKLARARPLQGRLQHGKVFFPEKAGWVNQAMQEMLRFPAGAHDDVVDALAWAAQIAVRQGAPRSTAPKEPPGWREKLDTVDLFGTSHMAA